MRASILAAGAAIAAASAPASAQVFTISGSLAGSCYTAALERDSSYDALETCNRAFKEQSLTAADEFATLVNRGIVRTIRKDHDGARSDFDRAIAMYPNRPEPWLNKAVLHFNSSESAEAIRSFSRALELGTSKAATAYYGRGLANEDSGNLEAAYADLRRAVSLRPDWAEPARELARYRVVER